MRLYKIENEKEAFAFEAWAMQNNVYYEELDECNYLDACPECGDYEFWHGGHCGHCGFEV